MTTTAPDRQPSTPGQARKRLADAKRHLFAHIIASAHLLDTPFVNAPDQSPWSRMKHAIAGLDAAIAALDASPTTYSLPAEPPETVTELWDRKGIHWRRDGDDTHHGYHFWVNDRGWVLHYPELLMRQYPLSTAPPAGTEEAS